MMSFYLNTNETQDPLSEGQHSDQQRDSDIVMKMQLSKSNKERMLILFKWFAMISCCHTAFFSQK